jgi:hypothetical protein
MGLNVTPDSLLVAMDKFPDFYGGMKFNYDAMWALLFRDNSVAFRYRLSRLDIMRKRRQIRRYHPFHVSRFLAYSALFQSLLLRWRMLTGLRTRRRLEDDPPDNIRDFVKALSRPNSIPARQGGSK